MMLRILSIDVWGNAKDGYELNDWIDSGLRVEVMDGLDDKGVIKTIRKACGHRADARGYYLECDGSICNVYRMDGKPSYFCDVIEETIGRR